MQTLKQLLHILKNKGFCHERSSFIDTEVVIGFDTERKPIITKKLTEEQLNYPISRICMRVGNYPIMLKDSRITATMRREGTVDSEIILSDNPLISPNIRKLEHLSVYNADNFSSGKSYAKDDCCLYKGQLYKALTTVPGHSPFDSNYWEKINPRNCKLIFMALDLPEKYLGTDLYSKKIIRPFALRALMEHHNTVISRKNYEDAINYYGNDEKFMKAVRNLLGFDARIQKTDFNDGYYIIFDGARYGKRRETDA